jgi:hypothetical protein
MWAIVKSINIWHGVGIFVKTLGRHFGDKGLSLDCIPLYGEVSPSPGTTAETSALQDNTTNAA